ncbi:MAG: 7-carboxy-7-deazaguanine synthase [Granulosicoccus sp.]|jgi:7-carboxy-7-deazaguanine synthase
MSKTASSLKITEIFFSIQGEAQTVGKPTVFVRLTGCPLRCTYCDSEYAFYGGERMGLGEIMTQVISYGASYVCVTGGEPLAQPDARALLTALCDQGLNVSIETSGALSVDNIDPRVSIVMDLKTPSSGEVARNDYANIALLRRQDQLKFVIGDRQDYEWSLFKVNEYALEDKVGEILFSPIYEQLAPSQLVEWILADRVPVRFQMQLHKALWGDKPGR